MPTERLCSGIDRLTAHDGGLPGINKAPFKNDVLSGSAQTKKHERNKFRRPRLLTINSSKEPEPRDARH
jgi:hypothetical protein